MTRTERWVYSPWGSTVGVAGAVVVCLLLSTCGKLVVMPRPLIVVPVVQWTIPLGMSDEARLCAATTLEAGVDPADTYPLRCVSIGTVRAWLRAQRFAE